MLFQITIHGEAKIDWDWEAWDFYETYFVEAWNLAGAKGKARRLLASRRRTYSDARGALTFNRADVQAIRSLKDLKKHFIEPECKLNWAKPSPKALKGETI